jgi:hypothetical protein
MSCCLLLAAGGLQGLSSAGVALSDPVGDVESLAAAAAAVAASSNSSGGGSLLDSGEFWMLLAAQSMAVGTVMVRWAVSSGETLPGAADQADQLFQVVLPVVLESNGCVKAALLISVAYACTCLEYIYYVFALFYCRR